MNVSGQGNTIADVKHFTGTKCDIETAHRDDINSVYPAKGAIK